MAASSNILHRKMHPNICNIFATYLAIPRQFCSFNSRSFTCRAKCQNISTWNRRSEFENGLRTVNTRVYSNKSSARLCTRLFSTDDRGDDDDRQSGKKIKPIFVAIPNPFKVIRNKIYFWMIRSYFDADFRSDEFVEGAKQALCTISACVSSGKLEDLEGLLSKKLLDEVKETCRSLTVRDCANIRVAEEDVLHSFPQNVAVHYDNSSGKFLNILMRFWCHSVTSEESDKGVVGLRIGRPPPGVSAEEFRNMGSVITCTYEFHRDFSPGVDPSWIVTYIQHGKWLNTEARWLPNEWQG